MKLCFSLAVFAALLSVSCSKITILRTKELVAVQDRVDSLRNEVFMIEEARQAKYEADAKNDELYKVGVELVLSRINSLLTQLAGNLAESQTRISEIDKKAGLISSYMAERARQDSLQALVKEQERLDLFNLAKSNYDKGKYKIAETDFNDYIQKYPNTEEAKFALYWTAEANFALNELDAAERIFKQYYSENRDAQYSCSALYKMGLIYEKQSKPKSRDAVWNQLAKQCPNSEETKLMKENQKK
jgi:TolA-binding protein